VNNEDEDVEEGELTESHSESHASSDDSPEDNGKQAVIFNLQLFVETFEFAF